MNTQQLNSVLGVIIGCISVLGTFAGVTGYYRQRLRELIDRQAGAAKKEYAAERAFLHLENNYKQLQASVDLLTRESDRRVEKIEIRLIRVETLMQVLTNRLTSDSFETVRDDNEEL